MKTLRGQLTIWFAGVLTITGLLSGLAAGYVTLDEQDRLFDDQLRQIALSVGDTPSAAGESYRITAGANPEDRIVVRILAPNGRLIRNSDPSADVPLMQSTGFSDHLDGDITWRIFTLVTDQRIIQVAQESEVRADGAMQSAINTILPIVLLIPISWLVVGWVVGRLLRPLNETANELASTSSGQEVRLHEQGVPLEILPLVQSVNGLLGRQHELLKFREQFISDAAHQLRTPLTALRLQLQNLSHEFSGTAHETATRELHGGVSRMSLLLNQLLNLARAEAPTNNSEEQAVLGDAIRMALADVIDRAVAKNIDLGLTADAQVTVSGNGTDVAMMIGNLLDNAIRHTTPGGRVDINIEPGATRTCVHIRDTGPGIPESALERVFDRFYRVAPSCPDGSGLGLPIVQALAQRMGAEVSLRNRADQSGLDATIWFLTRSAAVMAQAAPHSG